VKKSELKQLIKEVINEYQDEDVEEYPDESDGYLTSDDGWDKEEIKNVGLSDWLSYASKIAYEINNGRRGSFGISGSTAKDLVNELEELRSSLENIISTINNNL